MIAERRIEIPEGVTVEIANGKLVVSGPKGTLERLMRYPGVVIGIEDSELVISTSSERKKINAMLGTYASHAKNMFQGVGEEYVYGMKVVYSHFPIQLKEVGNKLEIVNFLGEKEPRYAEIPGDVKLKIAGDEITLTGIDKEMVGTAASRIEKATKVRGRDSRVFQDGIYIVSKA